MNRIYLKLDFQLHSFAPQQPNLFALTNYSLILSPNLHCNLTLKALTTLKKIIAPGVRLKKGGGTSVAAAAHSRRFIGELQGEGQ